MNRPPYPFEDFERVKRALHAALCEHQETYALLTADTGSGKTALLRQLRAEIDRSRYRVLYFSEARRLGASGLVKVIGETLRIRTSMCHALTLDRLLRALVDETQTILIWLDEAHDLPEETLDELRALAESDLDGQRRIHVLLCGLPRLRMALQSRPHMWRRIVVREEICGLVINELEGFLEHHFPDGLGNKLCDAGRSILFERARGAPGLILPMYRAVLRAAGDTKTEVDSHKVDEILERWDLA